MEGMVELYLASVRACLTACLYRDEVFLCLASQLKTIGLSIAHSIRGVYHGRRHCEHKPRLKCAINMLMLGRPLQFILNRLKSSAWSVKSERV